MRRYYAEAVYQYTSSMSTSRQRSLSNSDDDEDDEEDLGKSYLYYCFHEMC